MIRTISTKTASAVVAASALVALACGGSKDAGSGPHADLVSKAIPKIEQELGLTFKTPPKLEDRSRADVAKFVMQQLTSPGAQRIIDGQQDVYRVLGLIPDTMQLGALLQRLLEEQIIGYYDPATKVLYVVDGAPKALLGQTITHELVHALQDQYVKIDSIQKPTDNADRQGAAQAILEGQAVFTQLLVDPSAGPMLRMPGGWDRIRDAMRDAQVGMPIFSSAPRAVREGLLFPYIGGADFVRRFIEHRPIKELLTDLPISSKQILNDDAYFTEPSKRDVPTVVTLPAPSSGTVKFTNSFGEFETRLVLMQHVKDEVLARRAASGLDGDQYMLIHTAQGDALAWASVWDTSVDAADFLDLVADAMRRRYEMGKQAPPADKTTRRLDVPAGKTHGARTVTVALEQRDGRPVVFFMDAPASAAPKLIDAGRITFSK